MSGPRKTLPDGVVIKERNIELENGEMTIDRDTEEPKWARCTEKQWEKKVELASLNGDMGEALKYADYANCVALYKEGLTVKEIQERFNHE